MNLIAFIVHSLKGESEWLQCRRPRFDSWVEEIHWRRDRLPSSVFLGFLGGSEGNPPAVWETWVHPWVGKIPWRREQLPTPVFFPGESHGQRSMVGYSPWGCQVRHDLPATLDLWLSWRMFHMYLSVYFAALGWDVIYKNMEATHVSINR